MKRLLKLALLVGGVVAVAKIVGAKKAEFAGLTEAEARAKLDTRLPSRMPEDKRAAVADKVVGKMRERGVLVDEPESASGDAADEAPAEGAAG